ncbi:MAG: AI-2E family transporter [Candidatus Latescibacterota bacterium]
MDIRVLLKLFLASLILIALVYVSLLIWEVITPFLLSYILLFVLKPGVTFFERRGLNHTLAVSLVFIATFGGATLLLTLFIPVMVNEFVGVRDNFSQYVQSFSTFVTSIKSYISQYSSFLFSFAPQEEILAVAENNIKVYVFSLFSQVPSILSITLAFILIIPFATFFLLLDEQIIQKKLIEFVPNRYFEVALNLIYNLNQQVGLILRGMFVRIVILTFITTAGFWIIDLKYPIIVGVLAGFTNLVPYVGPIFGTALAFLVAIMTGAPQIIYLYLLLITLVIHLVDNALIQPIVFSKSTNLHPLFVLFLIALGSVAGGVIGMFLIVPAVSLLKVFLVILYSHLSRPKKPAFSLYRKLEPPL